MQTGAFYFGSYGMPITFKLQKALTDVDSMQLTITTPQGSSSSPHTIPNENITDAARGTLFYTVGQNDFPVAGTYKLELKITEPGSVISFARWLMEVKGYK